MRTFKRFLLAVFALFIILGGLAFILENQQPTSLVFLGWVGPQLPTSVIVVLAFLVGLLLGPMLSWCVRLVRPQLRRLV